MPEINVMLSTDVYKETKDRDVKQLFTDLREALAKALSMEDASSIELREFEITGRSQNCEPLIVETKMGPKFADRHERIHALLSSVCGQFVWAHADATDSLGHVEALLQFQLCSKFRTIGDHGQIYRATQEVVGDKIRAVMIGGPWIDEALLVATK